MFFFWILRALEETKKYLHERQQVVKFNMMRKFTNILGVGYVVCVLAVMSELYFKFQMGERDQGMWRYEWIIESIWFAIFTLFLLAVMALMRPNEHSRLLAHVEELGDSDRTT